MKELGENMVVSARIIGSVDFVKVAKYDLNIHPLTKILAVNDLAHQEIAINVRSQDFHKSVEIAAK